MSDFDDPLHRAAAWYAAAFGAIAAVLIGGIGLANLDWGRADHPVLAALVAATAVAVTAVTIFVACRVLTPAWTADRLRQRQQRIVESGLAGGWAQIAAADQRILAPLYLDDGFDGTDDSPRSLYARSVREDETQRKDAHARLVSMVDAANRRTGRRWFALLTWLAPVALLLILGGVMAWGTLARPDPTGADVRNPIPVRVRLAPGVDAVTVYGPGCAAVERPGVAVDGSIQAAPLVAFPAPTAAWPSCSR